MANVCATNLGMFDLGAQAAIHALLLDPLCAAICSPAQIKAMTLELFAAEKAFLPDYR